MLSHIRSLILLLCFLGCSAGAQAVALTTPYIFDLTSTVDSATESFNIDISFSSLSSESVQTIQYDQKSRIFSVVSTRPEEVFTFDPLTSTFHDVWTLNEVVGSTERVLFATSFVGPQSFSTPTFTGSTVDSPFYGSTFVNTGFLITNPASSASVTFDLLDPGTGGIFVNPLAVPGGAPELNPACSSTALAAMLSLLALLGGRRRAQTVAVAAV